MLTVHEALARCLTAVTPMPWERVSLDLAYGRVLADDVCSPLHIPPWDNSAMDGFAVVAADTAQVPVRLRVLETIGAGQVPTCDVVAGTCARIMTGAPMPSGADAVVMVEQTDGGPEDMVEIRATATVHQNVRDRGNDVAQGDCILPRGTTLGPAEVGMLSALGLPSARVAQRPVVAVLSTGDEIVEAGWPLADGQIHSSNTHCLIGLVREAGGVPLHCGIAPDDPDGLRAALARCLRADLVLTTGGVSMGDFDYVKDAFEEEGATLDFWKVSIKPGKPLAFGAIGGRPVFGLPGNPVSCMVNFLQFVRPVMRQMVGDPRPYLPVLTAELTAPIRKRPGRALLARVSLRRDGERLLATPTTTQSSGALSSMVLGDALTLMPVDSGSLGPGDPVRVQVLRWGWSHGETPDYGWS
jgi:molybdopterin molybdotransferase